MVYREKPTTPDPMKEKIRNGFQSVTRQALFNTNEAFKKRIRSNEEGGGHIEHLV